jgi:transposase
VAVLVANRLAEHPASEHALAAWLESDYVCDRQGRRYVADWEQKGRVKVSFAQLQRWYRSLDQLLIHKDDIELGLFERLRDLFHLRPRLVFYDITSSYFEGRGPDLAKRGYSRDGKPRKVQVIVGVVMVAGWPIAHHVWEGNRKDQNTVPDVIEDLAKRFQFEQVVFVGDRGMVSKSNFKTIGAGGRGYGHILGMVRRRNPQVEELIDRVDDNAWAECPVGINAQEKQHPPRTRAQEVEGNEQGERYIVVESEERLVYEQAMRKKSMERVREALEKVKQRVESGRLKNREKIGAAVERALKRSHGDRYYDWELKDGKLRYFEHEVHLRREEKYEGKYLIQSDQKELSVTQIVDGYKELNEVERGFRSLKNPIGISIRPIHHKNDDRVKAHIFVAALAFLLERYLEKSLEEAASELSARDALKALQTIRRVSFTVNGEVRDGVTPGTPRAQQVLKILGITNQRPPTPPAGQETIM